MSLHLETLGGIRLVGVEFQRPKPLLLLAYLSLEGPKPRRDLTTLFFSDSDQQADALSTTLRRLRAVKVIDESGGRVAATVNCDANLLREHFEQADLERVLELYSGVFAAGLSGHLGTDLEEWVFQTRERLAGLVRLAHLELGERALEQGDTRHALKHAEAATHVPGAKEPAQTKTKRLKQLLEHLGNSSANLAGTPRTSKLPLSLTSFVGRNHETKQVLEILAGTAGRLITIHGSGGVGKSRFALEVARLAFEHDSSWQGVHLVQLEFLEKPDGLAAAIALALDLPPPAGSDPFAALASSMGHSRRMLVLDNFEHLIAAASALPRLLSACSGLALIITSRERLNLRAEWVLDLEGLPIAPHNATLEEQRVSPAVLLFMDRARHARVNLEFDADHLQDAVHICELTDGYPLALELAAASLRMVPLAELARTLKSTALDLESPHRDNPDRHRSVRTVFEHSWQRLSATEQHGLACLASFQGGFTREAALAVASVDGHALEGFADRSLVQVSPTGRFGFHPLLHSFLRSKLSADTKLEEHALELHALYFGNILQSLNVQAHGAADAGVMDYMASEEGNLVALLRYSLQHQQFDTLANLAEPFLWYMPLRGRFAEALQLNVEILEGLPENDPAANGALAAFLTNASWLYRLVGDLEQAVALARQALQLVETSGNTLQHMRVLDGLGQALFLSGSFDAGITKVGKALEIARSYGDDTRLLRALSNLGAGYTTSGNMQKATQFYTEARALYDTGRVLKGMDVVWLLSNIGYQNLLIAEFDEVIAICDEALGVAREARCDGQMTLLWALTAFARLERYLEGHDPTDLEIANSTCVHAVPAAKQSGEKFSGVMLLTVESRIMLEHGNTSHATELLLEGLQIALESGNRIAFLWALPYYIEALIALSKLEKAAELTGFIAAQPSNGVWMKARVARLEVTLETRFDDQKLFEAGKSRGSLLSSESTKERLLAMLEISDNHAPFLNPEIGIKKPDSW